MQLLKESHDALRFSLKIFFHQSILNFCSLFLIFLVIRKSKFIVMVKKEGSLVCILEGRIRYMEKHMKKGLIKF